MEITILLWFMYYLKFMKWRIQGVQLSCEWWHQYYFLVSSGIPSHGRVRHALVTRPIQIPPAEKNKVGHYLYRTSQWAWSISLHQCIQCTIFWFVLNYSACYKRSYTSERLLLCLANINTAYLHKPFEELTQMYGSQWRNLAAACSSCIFTTSHARIRIKSCVLHLNVQWNRRFVW